MATPRFVGDGNNGRFAIMTNADPGDSAANIADPSFTDPVNHLGDYKWHSSLYYLGCDPAPLTGTINLQYQSAGWTASGNDYVLTIANHGKSYTPIIVGYLTIGGINVPINGTILAFSSVGTTGGSATISLNIYADASGIIIRMNGILGPYFKNVTNVGYTLYVCNIGKDAAGNLVLPASFNGLEVGSSRFRAGYYDTNFGYFNKDASGPITLYRGRSLDVDVGALPSSSSYFILGVVQNINGYSFTGLRSQGGHDTVSGINYPGTNASFTPTVDKVSAALPSAVRGFEASTGRIQLGNTLDTNNNTLLISNYIQPTLNIPSITLSAGTATYRTDTYDLGACNSNATLLMGLFTLNGQTFSIGGTNLLLYNTHKMPAAQSWSATTGTGSNLPSSGRTFYLSIVAGRVIATVRTFYPRVLTGTVAAQSLQLNIFAGTFDY